MGPCRAALLALLLVPAGCDLPKPIEGATPALGELQTGETWQGRGIALLRAGDYSRARRMLIRSLRLEGESSRTYSAIGLAAEKQGQLGEAERWFLRARVTAPRSELAHNNLGVVYFKQGKLILARRAFARALDLSDGENRVARNNLALVDKRLAGRAVENIRDPRINHRLERTGTSEYLLSPIHPDAKPG